MRLTSHSDYALRMLVYLAMRPDRVSTVSEVSETYRLSRNHLLKVALTLRKLGLVETMRGRAGGIRLAMPPADINIGALIRATEEDLALVECMQARGGACAIAPGCMLKGMFAEALAAWLAVLDKYTLADAMRNRTMLSSLFGMDRNAA